METKKRQKKGFDSSDAFWRRFRRRMKKLDAKSKTFTDYSVQISPSAAGKPKALVRILSISKRDVIPLKIVSPIETEVVSVKSQRSQEKKESVTTPARRSWVRIVVRAFRSPTSRNGKSRQVPSNETSLEVPPKIRTSCKPERSTPKKSTAEPVAKQISEIVQNNTVEQQISEATVSKPVQNNFPEATPKKSTAELVAQQISEIVQNNTVEQQISEATVSKPVQNNFPEATQRNSGADPKKKGIVDRNPRSKLKGHASAPCSPMKSHRLTASMASTSYTHLSAAHISTIEIHNSTTFSKSTIKTALDSEIPPTFEQEVYAVAIRFSPLIVVMLCLVFSDKCVAILCTCVWWYAVAILRNISTFKEKPPSSKNSKQLTKSLSQNYTDLQSREYRKKVIMNGILQRNNNTKT